MSGYTIALVPGKSILRIFLVEGHHQAVARHLGDDACRRNAQAQRVASHQGRVFHGQSAHGEAVNECMGGLPGQSIQCARHGEMRGAEDVEAVNFPGVGLAGGPEDFASGCQSVIKGRPRPCGELLGIGEACEFEIVGQDHRRGHHGTGERAASGFIHTGDQCTAPGMQGMLVGKVAGHRAARGDQASLRADA